MLSGQYSEHKNKIAHKIKYPANFTEQSFHELINEVLDQANGILLNRELSQLHTATQPETLSKAPRPQCGNPKCPYPTGHMTATCWHEGGGDPSGKEKYEERCKAKLMPRANYASGEVLGEEPPNEIPHDDPSESNTCTEIAESNKDIFYSYISGSYECIQLTANTLFNLCESNPKTFFSAMQSYNSLLDSGCTHHIIKDKKHFHSYNTSQAIPVTTANCGTLPTKAMGEVRFSMNVNGRTATVVL